MPRPGDSLFGLELLRELQDALALVASSRQTALELRERADALDRAAAAHEAMIGERLADTLRELTPRVPPPQPAHRPRLEESYRPEDLRRTAAVLGMLERHPGWSDRQIATRAGVHHSVVSRLRAKCAESRAESTPEAQKPRGKGSA